MCVLVVLGRALLKPLPSTKAPSPYFSTATGGDVEGGRHTNAMRQQAAARTNPTASPRGNAAAAAAFRPTAAAAAAGTSALKARIEARRSEASKFDLSTTGGAPSGTIGDDDENDDDDFGDIMPFDEGDGDGDGFGDTDDEGERVVEEMGKGEGKESFVAKTENLPGWAIAAKGIVAQSYGTGSDSSGGGGGGRSALRGNAPTATLGNGNGDDRDNDDDDDSDDDNDDDEHGSAAEAADPEAKLQLFFLLDGLGLGQFLDPLVALGCGSVRALASMGPEDLAAAGLKKAQVFTHTKHKKHNNAKLKKA
jgi:hypothetical protein